MANIEKRRKDDGSLTYRAKVRLKGYPSQSATFNRLTDARNWAADTESAIRQGKHFQTVEAKKHTVAEMIDRYIENELPDNPKSSATKVSQLSWWRAEIGANVLANATPSLIAQARDKLANTPNDSGKLRSPATVVRYMAALSHVFTIAVKEWEWVETNPLTKVRKPKEPEGRMRFLSDHERERLLKACRESSSDHLYLAVVLSLSTGARRAEILGMEWRQVDLKRGSILLDKTKNGERRLLPLAGHALELMKERAKVRRIDTDAVFAGRSDAKYAALRVPWVKAMEAAEITDFRWHDLRHSAASYLAMNGATLAEIADVLGHKTLQMVKRYAHLSESHRSDVVTRMNNEIFGGTSL